VLSIYSLVSVVTYILVQYLQAVYRNALQVRKLVMKGKGKSQALVRSYLLLSLWTVVHI